MGFEGDADRGAFSGHFPGQQRLLELSSQESFWIGRLLFYRDSFEHPEQLTFIMTRRRDSGFN